MVNIKALMTLWIRDWFKLFEHKKKHYVQMGHYKKLEYQIVNIEKPIVNLYFILLKVKLFSFLHLSSIELMDFYKAEYSQQC